MLNAVLSAMRHLTEESRQRLKGWGVFRPVILKNVIFRQELKGKARIRPDILRMVSGPCAQCCLCQALEQKLGMKPKSKPIEIELFFVLKKQAISKKISISHEKLPSYAQQKVARQSRSWPISGQLLAIFATFFETSTLNLFCASFTLRLVCKPITK